MLVCSTLNIYLLLSVTPNLIFKTYNKIIYVNINTICIGKEYFLFNYIIYKFTKAFIKIKIKIKSYDITREKPFILIKMKL